MKDETSGTSREREEDERIARDTWLERERERERELSTRESDAGERDAREYEGLMLDIGDTHEAKRATPDASRRKGARVRELQTL